MKTRAVTRRILDALERHHPDADTELVYSTPFELLVATILSAQSSDARVNQVTPALFVRYPSPRSLAEASGERLEEEIKPAGFFRQKARALLGMAQALVRDHAGEVPCNMAALTELPGVGRKTANVVLGHAMGVAALPVDRHVLKVSNRLGLAQSDDPVQVESALCALIPPERWTNASDLLILHGRRICRPAPLCPTCNARRDCDFFLSASLSRGRSRTKRPPASARRKRT